MYIIFNMTQSHCYDFVVNRFLRATALLVARICYGNSVRLSVCPSVCPSVRPSHVWISQ